MSNKLGPLAGKTFIDLFAGIGGFHLGMSSVGMNCVFSSEWDKHAAAVYKNNFKRQPEGDITKIEAKNIPKHFMVCGGFPCQAFSISGNRQGFKDTRGTLFFEIARIVEHHEPSVLFLENVKNLAQHDKGNTLKTILSVLDQLGYTVFHQVMNAAAYSFPTARQRIYIVAFRKDVGVHPKTGFQFPPETNTLTPLKNYLEKKPSASLSKINKTPDLDNDKISGSYVANRLKRNPIAPVRVGTIAGGGQGDRVYSAEGPAITLSAYGGGNAAKTGAYWIDGGVRKLTPRECANIMGFPKTYKIDTKHNQAYKQFGNSVVVGVIELIAKSIENALELASKSPFVSIPKAAKAAVVKTSSQGAGLSEATPKRSPKRTELALEVVGERASKRMPKKESSKHRRLPLTKETFLALKATPSKK